MVVGRCCARVRSGCRRLCACACSCCHCCKNGSNNSNNDRENHNNNNNNDDTHNDFRSCDVRIRQSFQTTVWRTPWIIFLGALYIVVVPWMIHSIILRYWNTAPDYLLPGWDTSTARKIAGIGHASCGILPLVLGPLLLWPRLRQKCPPLHRWMGRFYILGTVGAAVLGLALIGLKGFRLVGDVNMGVAFFCAGLLMLVCAGQTIVKARQMKKHPASGAAAALSCNNILLMQQHRNWAIRTHSQVLAPFFYRYAYLVLGGLQWYPTQQQLAEDANNNDDTDCDAQNVCRQFTRPFDQMHVWTYFLFPLAVAELVIFCLRPKDDSYNHDASNSSVNSSLPIVSSNSYDRAADEPLEDFPPSPEVLTYDDDDSSSAADSEYYQRQRRQTKRNTDGEPDSLHRRSTPLDAAAGNAMEVIHYRRLNSVAVLAALAAVASTTIVYLTIFLEVNRAVF